MSERTDQQTYRRAMHASIVGLIVQALLTIGAAILGVYSENSAVNVATWHLLGGTLIWFMLFLLFNQHRLERIETLENEQLRASGGGGDQLFDEKAEDLATARRRLSAISKWGMNGAALGLAVYLLAVSIWPLVSNSRMYRTPTLEGQSNRLLDNVMRSQPAPADPLVVLAAAAAGAFICFITARYIAGMTRVKPWQPLRGGAGYLMGNFIVLLLIAAAATIGYFGNMRPLSWLGLIVPGFVIVLAVEILAAALLSAYRPRKPGEVPRAAFDSRILGFLTSPQSIGQILNETINYQFGFEVSRSWFYRLLGKAVAPLLGLGLGVLWLMSGLVIVQPHEQAVVMRLGQISSVEPLGPGLHVKWPWPIGRVEKYPVGRVQTLQVGSIVNKQGDDVAVLWTNVHTEGEEAYFLAGPTPLLAQLRGERGAAAVEGEGSSEATGMSLVAAEVIVQYHIADLMSFVRAAEDPRRLLKSMADSRVAAYFAGRDIDTLLVESSASMGPTLEGQIQDDADEAGLGVQIVLVAVTNIHPPQKQEVAAEFQAQIAALQSREAMRQDAQRQAIETLARLAGSREQAEQIDGAILRLARLERELESKRSVIDAAGEGVDEALAAEMNALAARVDAEIRRIETMLAASQGEAASLVYAARAQRWAYRLSEQAAAQRFEAERAAFRAAPRYYLMKRYYDALSRGLEDTVKYIVDKGVDVPWVRLDLRKQETGLFDVFDQGRD